MFGRHPHLPIDVEYEVANPSENPESPDLVEPTEEAIEQALENLLNAKNEAKIGQQEHQECTGKTKGVL